MDFQLTEDQKMLAKTVADFAKQSSPVARFRKLRDDERGFEPSVWKQMGDLGWLGVPFPEATGGFGGSFVDVALVLEKLGTTLVPEPYVSSVVLGGMAILHGGDAKQHERFLTPMIEGKTTLSLAYAERHARYDVTDVRTGARKEGSGYRLEGEKVWVLDGHAADHHVVSARLDGELALFVVDRDAKGLTTTPVKLLDGHRGAFLRLDGVAVDADRLLAAADGASVLDRVLDGAAVAACAEGMGIVSTMLQMSVDYLKEREQFGVKIGTFQALQHRAVDMFVEAEVLRSLLIEASVRAGTDDPEAKAAVSAAKVQLATGGKFVSQQAIQLHGGIGITDEHDIGLYFKRMEALNRSFGDEAHHLRRYAALPSSVTGMAVR